MPIKKPLITTVGRTGFSYLRPLRLDFYILEEIISNFIGICFFITFILIMFQALRLAEFFIIHGTSAYLLGKMTLYLSVSSLPTSLPLSFLVAILVAFGRMSGDNEVIAMKANGLSMVRIAFPIFLLASLVTFVSIFMNNYWVPTSVMEFKRTQVRISNTKAVTAIKEGTFTSGFFDLLIFSDRVDSKNNRLQRVFIYDEREKNNPLTYVANEAEMVPLKVSSDLGAAIMMRLFDGTMHHNNLETHTYEKIDFDTYNLYLKIDEGADNTLLKPHMILHKDLIHKIATTPPDTYFGREYRGEYWRRYANCISPLIFVLLGIGFGTFRNRTAKAGAFLTGLIVISMYWILQTAGTSALLSGSVSPFIAMQFPNTLLLLIGLIGFKRASW